MDEGCALLVGRFQPFHKGHLNAVKKLAVDFKSVIIGLGSAQYSHTPENPFTSGERIQMIKKALDSVGISNYKIISIDDLHTHSLWVAHVVSLVPLFSTVFTNDPLTKRLFKEAGYNVQETPLYKREEYSGTEVRKRMLEGSAWEHLVPEEVAECIKKIDGVDRIRSIGFGK